MHRLRQTLKIPEVQRMADLFAVSSSGLCMIHCLATPVLLIFVPVFSASFLGGEAFHAAILWFILPTSLVAMTLGCWRHKERGGSLRDRPLRHRCGGAIWRRGGWRNRRKDSDDGGQLHFDCRPFSQLQPVSQRWLRGVNIMQLVETTVSLTTVRMEL
jgi:MerC mercury resistance protein